MSVHQDHRWLATRIALVLLLLVAAVVVAYHFRAISKDRGILWKIAHDRCVPDEEEHHKPAPCVRVDLAHGEAQGYVILKDIRGKTQFLLIPTQRISGIESPILLAPDAENYWADAWANRGFVMAQAKNHLGWNDIGLAINSSAARSQDQLHIHIDCLRPDVRALLARHIGEIGTTWTRLSFNLAGQDYLARRLAAADLASENPFKLLAQSVPDAGQNMGQETLAVVGVSFVPGDNGFVLLAAKGSATPGLGAHAEHLLDHSCALAKAK